MALLAIGSVLLLLGLFSLNFPELISSVKANDKHQWEVLGSPPPYSFHKTAGVFSWVLHHGYENCSSKHILEQGEKALKKALFAKYTLLSGLTCLVVGFFTTLL